MKKVLLIAVIVFLTLNSICFAEGSTTSSFLATSSTSTSETSSTGKADTASEITLEINSKKYTGKDTKANICTFDYSATELVVNVTGSTNFKVSGITNTTIDGQKITVPLSTIKKAGNSKTLTVKDASNSKIVTKVKLVRGKNQNELTSFTLRNSSKEFTSKIDKTAFVEIKDKSPIYFNVTPTPSTGKLVLKEKDKNVKNNIISMNAQGQVVINPTDAMIKTANKITSLIITDNSNTKAKVKVNLKYVPEASANESSNISLIVNSNSRFEGKNTSNIYEFDYDAKEVVVKVLGTSNFKASGLKNMEINGDTIKVPVTTIKKAGASKTLTVKDANNSKKVATVKLVKKTNPYNIDKFVLKNGNKEFNDKTDKTVFVEISDKAPIVFNVTPTPSTGKLVLKEKDKNVKNNIISMNVQGQVVINPTDAMVKKANKVTSLTITDNNNSKAKVKVNIKYIEKK